MSVDARHVCGCCLAPEPGVLADTHSSGRNVAVVHTRIEPGVSADPTVRILSLPHGRCYRIAAPAPVAAERVKHLAEVKTTMRAGVPAEEQEDEEEENGVTTEMKQQQQQSTAPAAGRRDGLLRGGRGPRNRKPYTHFLSLPIGKLPGVQASAEALLQAIKRRCVDPGAMVTEDIFTTAPRMHLTLLMLSLPTREALAMAVECMRVLQEEVRRWQAENYNTNNNSGSNSRPDKDAGLQIRLGGLHVMTGRGQHEKKADVLYMGLADAASNARVAALQQLVHNCFAEFTTCDPRVEESRQLHMTLMNTKWRRDGAVSGGQDTQAKWPPRVPFDATRILREFAQATLCGDGAVTLERIELNALGYDTAQESYPCESVVSL
ncbi:hypothetical protein DQ04_10991030 [Trypanosoma grayi]|uniref:hypothetical protein n=1 Tax=Trypanosoma grayi TaxID=71804 RepID=UPI0004F44780|nr:hypothetical protein DQ04_10991030 [Trypanosoma grayi]KEG07081.1 hypothetical protein DQ04_10991030 [Trypanosoma grayi]